MADFTIVTPVLNQVSTIEACIKSVANQNVSVEHIIIDGGSTDGTLDVIRKYQDRIAYWKSEPDNGQSEAINKGLAKARGTFFNWLNADDELTSNALKTVSSLAGREPDLIVGRCQHVDQNGKEVVVGSAKIWSTLEATLGNYSMGQPSVFYRTSVIKDLGGVNENLHLCMDMELWFRFLLKKGLSEIDSTSSVLSRFLVRDDSKSSSMKDEMKKEKYGVFNALFSRFNPPPVLEEFFENYPVPAGVSFSNQNDLNSNELIANFVWHLMIISYESGDFKTCKKWYELVTNGNRLSNSEKLIWQARIASGKLLKS